MNHFELFGLSCQYELDDGLLSSKFLDLQRRFHPDKFASGTEKDKLFAVQHAANINIAYQILKDPIQRAEYILLLKGFDVKDERRTLQEPQFLIQQMALREELEEIADVHDEDGLIAFEQKVQMLFKESLQRVIDMIAAEDWHNAVNGVQKLKFIIKLQQEIERVEDQLLG